jgi:hypothetical protein
MSDTASTPEATTGELAPAVTSQVETFSREYVESLRNEAAKYRTEKTGAVEAAKTEAQAAFDAKLAERDTAYTELEGQLGVAGVELTKLRIALELGVPSEKVLAFAEILKGATEEELKESGTKSFELFSGLKSANAAAIDPTQGSGNHHLPLNGDPLLAALKRAVGA